MAILEPAPQLREILHSVVFDMCSRIILLKQAVVVFGYDEWL